MNILSTFCRIAPGLLLAGAGAVASAQAPNGSDFPSKPIHMYVGLAPGGATDIMARGIAQKLSELDRQPVVVDNRPGAAGSIAAATVAKAPADGYTILIVSSSYAINPALTPLTFDPRKDLAPVVLLAEAPFVLVVNPERPVHNVAELIAYSKSSGRELTFASGGTGSSGHLAGELFKSLTGARMLHIPYKGAGPAAIDVMAGQVDMTFASIVSALPHIKAAKMRPLGVTSTKRSAALPDLPTIAEQGVRGYQTVTWYGILAPAGTPKNIIDKLNADFGHVIKSKEVHDRLALEGAEPAPGTPEEFGSYLDAELRKWAKIIHDVGLHQ